jgi:hypothetical protein
MSPDPQEAERDLPFQYSLRSLLLATSIVAAGFALGYYFGLWAYFGLPVWTGLIAASLSRTPFNAFFEGFGYGFLSFFLLPLIFGCILFSVQAVSLWW